jgi:uncharacterized protein
MKPTFLLIFLGSYFSLAAQFTTEEKVLATSTGNLKGTLYLPKKTNKLSLVVVQAGSGATDRNGNSIPIIKASPYRLLAEALAEKNIATLLIDKRGIGASMTAMKKEVDLRFDDYAKDLADWVRFVKNDNRINKIFLAGHSEGSLLAMLTAQMENVNGYISIAGAGESIDKIVVWQYKQQLPKTAFVVDSLFTRMRNGEPLDTIPPMLMSIFRPSIQPYFASWMKYDPAVEIKKLTIPVLILQGTTDIQVEIKEAEYLKAAKPNATYVLIEGMNHVLKEAPADRQKNIAIYSAENVPLKKELVAAIYKFVNKSK